MCLSPALSDIFEMIMARYSLFVLKVPLNTSQPTVYASFIVRRIHDASCDVTISGHVTPVHYLRRHN